MDFVGVVIRLHRSIAVVGNWHMMDRVGHLTDRMGGRGNLMQRMVLGV